MSSDNSDPVGCTANETAPDRKQECPECGGDVYYEPWLHGGTEYEFHNGHTSGWACDDCSWSEPHSTPDDQQAEIECPRDDCDNETKRYKVEANGKCDSCRRQDRLEKMAREREREGQPAE